MAIVSVNNAGKDFGDITILEHITFEVQEKQRVGLVGKNGAGKTTLIKLISGVYECDEGSVYIPSAVKLGVLDQIPNYPDHMTVDDVLRTAFSGLDRIKRRMNELEKMMSESDDPSLLREYGELSAAYEVQGGYETDIEINKIANGLNISTNMRKSSFNRLSGGERTRINLGRMILMNVDLMLLDEPTNHLDMQSVEWLEDFINNSYKGAAIIISHDRYFLDRTVTRIIEVENLTTRVWEGNYSAYIHQKEEERRAAESRIKEDEKKIKQLEYTARRLHSMGTKKQHKTAFNIEKRIERMRKEQPLLIKQGKNIRASFTGAGRSGNDVLEINGLKKSYGDRVLFSGVDLEVKKDDRIAIIGSNGAGKTTLLKIILGEEPYDSGRVKWGVGVKKAYLQQIVSFANERTTVLDCVISELNVSPEVARNRLGSFHFFGDDVFKLVYELSGGEKSRLKLCILMYQGVNMLILDEPTNHLDIQSREWVEQAIDNFDGTLLLVSHDRYFVSHFAERIWSLENGGIVDFDGGYEEYREYSEAIRSEKNQESEATEKRDNKREKPTTVKKHSKEYDNLRKQVPVLERDIEKKEQELSALNEEMNLVASDHIKLSDVLERKQIIENELEMLMTRWEEILEKIEN